MKPLTATTFTLAALLLSFSGLTHAQQAGLTREQVKMDRDAFLAMHQWHGLTMHWVLKPNLKPPAGVMPREEVIAMRDKFLTMNQWDDAAGQWMPVKGAPRDMSAMGREQVEMETAQFLMTHRFDESSSQWVMKTKPTR